MENEMDVFGELVKHEPGLLSRPIEELAPISFIGQAAVAGYRSLIGRLDTLPMTEEQKAKTLADGQEAGKMLLAIEGRIGELLFNRENKNARAKGNVGQGTALKTLPESITPRQSHNAQAIANNPEAVAEVIAEAEENEDIPTKTAVINKVKAKKAEAAAEKYKREVKENTQATTGDALKYLGRLRQIVLLLPKDVPSSGWTENSHAEAKSMVEMIQMRLGVWNEQIR